MPVTKKSATAFVNVRGLGIVCFNPQENRSETALIRSGNHQLSVNILRPEFDDGSGKDAIVYVPDGEFAVTDADNVTIEITGVGHSRYAGYEIFETGEFDRLHEDDNDDHDFRWILNLEGAEMHNASLVKNELSAMSAKPSVTRLYIANGLFYAVMPNETQRAKTPFFRKTDASGTTDFGYLAETMGVNLEADEVLIRISVGGVTRFERVLPKVAGLPFKIEVTNVDPDPNAMTSDLPVCYQFLQPADGQEFSLTPREEATTAGGSVIGKNYCHISRLNQDSIENFL